MPSVLAPAAPIHHGSDTYREVEVGPLRITEARFGSGSRIEPHFHDRTNIGVMLGGSFDVAFGTRRLECHPGTAFVEPAGETHCNCMGCQGAWVLAIQPDERHPLFSEAPDAFAQAVRAPGRTEHPHIAHLARRITREIRGPQDAYSALLIEGLTLELFALVGRNGNRPAIRPEPAWMTRIEAELRATPPRRIRLGTLAREAGVHSAHLARAFRKQYGQSIGSFLLERRLEWAAMQLEETDRPIVEIALQSGFADQSHFTRRFRQRHGVTPGQYRLRRSPG